MFEGKKNSYADLCRQQEEQRADAQAKKEAEIAEKISAWLVEDEAERVAARDYVAPVTVEQAQSGPFLLCDKLDMPLQCIEGINVIDPGMGPHQGWAMSPYAARGWAEIGVTMISGQKYRVQCSRWHVDFLFTALRNAWRTHR